jgi:hypothetical protein
MDVYGQNPSSKEGKYFRASIWTWPAVYSLTLMLCADLLDEETKQGMDRNDGAGVKDVATCREMARRVREWLKENPGEYTAYVEHEFTLVGQIEQQLARAGWQIEHAGPASTRSAPPEMLQAWAEFLEHCGGFEVW